MNRTQVRIFEPSNSALWYAAARRRLISHEINSTTLPSLLSELKARANDRDSRTTRSIVVALAIVFTLIALTGFSQDRWLTVAAVDSGRLLPADPIPQVDLTILNPKFAKGESQLSSDPSTGSLHDHFNAELTRQLKLDLPGLGQGVIVDNIMLPQKLDLPSLPWQVNFNFRFPQKGVGTVVFTALIAKADERTRRITGSLSIDRTVTGVQARRLIRRGEKIGPDDIITLEAPLSQLPTDTLSKQDFLIGTAARSEIRPGLWLTGRMLELPDLVKSRQPVTMKLNNGPIQITAKGVARQSGALGEIIRIENTQSKREVLARIISSDLVEVVF